QLEQDRRMLERLDEIRLQQAGAEVPKAGPAYKQAFQEYGLDPGAKDREEAAARIRRMPELLRAAVIAALEEWARIANPDEKKELNNLIRLVDPDAWRHQLREAVSRKDRAALEKLAREVEVRRQPVFALLLLARSLQATGAGPSAVTLLRQVQ